ncbi:hypothetical protein [Bacillus sp. AR18-7]|uniref:hypothetical protein n=1 Tax=Bacillus sp. AR18-7 TaxID=2217821 RepID=UPI0021034A58|nr:hypothetical protein [Bacillus sp. AR18-7]
MKKYEDKYPGMNHAIELCMHTTKTVKEICQITGVDEPPSIVNEKNLNKVLF